MRTGFIGFGEAARAFRVTLAEAEPALRFLAWDVLLRDPASGMREALAAAGVVVAEGPGGLCAADWIVSAVTAGQSLVAIETLAPHLRQGQVVIDINSVSPGRKRASVALVEARGAQYLDMAVMAPVHPRGHRTPVLIAGAPAEGMAAVLAALGFSLSVAGTEPGQATAIKMVRSLFVKGLEALTVETLLAAEASGCREQILASLGASYPELGWPEGAAYAFERVMAHGVRRAEEMIESAATLDGLGLTGDLARAIATVQAATARPGVAAGEIGELLPGLLAVRMARRA